LIPGGKTLHSNSDEITDHARNTFVNIFHTVEREQPVAGMTQLTEIERRQLVVWNTTRQNYPQDACVHQLVARQAAATPDAVAVVMGDQVLSYRELNERANQLGHLLQTLGVGPDVLVGLCLERSLEMIVGMLGILKAGGAYVPLDPDYPSERLTFMLQDAQVPLLVTKQHLVTQLLTQSARVVCLDADAALSTEQSTNDPVTCKERVYPHPENLAYVIYTSGSTGQPKGVQITHNSLLNLVFWHLQAFDLTPSDRATQVTSPAFDATCWELWPYLIIGARVYLADEDMRTTPVLLRDWLVSKGITITFLPTALAESVMTLEWPATTSLRLLLTGADTLHSHPSPGLPFTLINNYGPTEATVVATSGPILPAEKNGVPPTIGRPISNTQIYILDENLRQVPIGTPGELYIGGTGLARGYLNRPELTSEKFLPHPFGSDPQARLYRTGDLARYLPDGQIAFMGRTDHQIKIRGYRIEPNEIMLALNRHPAIQTSLVIAREEIPGDKRLVAYIVLAPGANITASSLRDVLATQLPDYMIPAIFVVLEALPLTPNGKLDRAALPVPDTANMLRDGVMVAPSTLIELRLAEIVTSLLGIEKIGIDDNFFLLGGSSLMGTQVITQVTEVFGVELGLLTLFNAPAVRQLSIEIEELIFARLDAMSDEEVLHLLP
jgi:amino acid adenylation domain-containing protein